MKKAGLALAMVVAMLTTTSAVSAQQFEVRLGVLSVAAQTASVVVVKEGFFEKRDFDVEARTLVVASGDVLANARQLGEQISRKNPELFR